MTYGDMLGAIMPLGMNVSGVTVNVAESDNDSIVGHSDSSSSSLSETTMDAEAERLGIDDQSRRHIQSSIEETQQHLQTQFPLHHIIEESQQTETGNETAGARIWYGYIYIEFLVS